MEKIVIANPFAGLLSMIVCVEGEATDEEILAVCNSQNPSGTTLGWCEVLHGAFPESGGPVQCSEYPERTHYVVIC